MNIEAVVNAGVTGRNHKRSTLVAKSDMTNESFIQDFIDYFAVVDSSNRKSLQSRPWRLSKSFHSFKGEHAAVMPGSELKKDRSASISSSDPNRGPCTKSMRT